MSKGVPDVNWHLQDTKPTTLPWEHDVTWRIKNVTEAKLALRIFLFSIHKNLITVVLTIVFISEYGFTVP